MNEDILKFLTTQAPAVVVLAIWWYYMTKYFMWVVDKKDEQNQSNLQMFIELVKENISVNSKFSDALWLLHPKLDEIHQDIKEIKSRK